MAQDAHIGPEHAHAQAAMAARVRELVARGGLSEAAVPTLGEPPTPAESPTSAEWPAPAGSGPAPAEPAQAASGPVAPRLMDPDPADSDEDLDFIDGRWTSEGW